jgi:voltage-gated potassium channel
MTGLRSRLHETIFEADTPAGKRFDVILLWAILASVVTVLLESVPEWSAQYAQAFAIAEWGFTGLFTLEYIVRLSVVRKPLKYAFSFYGLVDLLSILPSFLGLMLPQSASLRVVRILRLLRVFRVFKLVGFITEAAVLRKALRTSQRKILVFLFAVLTLVTIVGTIMYILEDEAAGFTSIPRSIYWAIVTVTTVGYGDIAPATVAGQMLASVIMIIGYAIIAVPTGIIGAEWAKQGMSKPIDTNTQACPDCGKEGHSDDALHCKHCGAQLNE